MLFMLRGVLVKSGQVFCKNTVQSESGYTVLSGHARYDEGSQLDFRAEAIIGYMFDTAAERRSWAIMDIPPNYVLITVASSGWSNIQTFAMPSASTSSFQTVSPQNPVAPSNNNQPQQLDQTQLPGFVLQQSFLLWIGALLFAGVAVVVVLVFLRGHLKSLTYSNNLSSNR